MGVARAEGGRDQEVGLPKLPDWQGRALDCRSALLASMGYANPVFITVSCGRAQQEQPLAQKRCAASTRADIGQLVQQPRALRPV